jgi:hypothetical protein
VIKLLSGLRTNVIAVTAGSALFIAAVVVLVVVTRPSGFVGPTTLAEQSSGPSSSTSPGPGTTSPASSQSPTPRPSSSARQPTTTNPGTGHHPTPATTGVPAGTKLTRLAPNDGDTHFVRKSGTVLNSVHIPGNLMITANNVTIRNSQIDGFVMDEYAGQTYSFSITDSTVGPANGCVSFQGIGEADFTALRVHVRGFSDGFRASGNNINIQDSYVHLCSNPGDHSDGIQSYLTGRGLTLNHTTIDQRDAKDVTAPIFIMDEQNHDVVITNNLVMGGTYSIRVSNVQGIAIVQNNSVVDGSWIYGPADADCGRIQWSGNKIVKIDAQYRITSVVRPLSCG